MQTDTQQDHDSRALSNQLLKVFALNRDPYDCATSLLQLVQAVCGGTEAGLISFGEFGRCVTTGDLTCDQLTDMLAPFDRQAAHGNGWIHEDDALIVPIHIDASEQPLGMAYFANADPSLIDNELTLNTLVDSFIIAIANIQAHEQKARAEQLATSVLNSTIDPLLIIDADKHVIHLNTAAEKVFAITSLDAYGKPMREVLHSDELWQLTGGKNKNQVEWVSEDNKTFIPRTEPVTNAQGQTEGWVLTLRDISHFKKLNRNQYEFTRNVTHDLRSPLTSMQGFASMLELGAVGELNEKQAHFIEKILSGINQIAILVDNIQDAGRYDPETGFYEMSREQCDLLELAQRIAENHLVPAEKGELQLTVHVADNVPIINADPTMLERALRNLVDNAIKYTPNGGTIEVGVEKRDEQVIISVTDSGLGISPEDQKRLFERGVRIHRTEHKMVKGSGLGLFIVRSVAQRHGGDAWVESAVNTGSTFYFSIPLEGPNLIGYEET